jgi:hypothetical protein
MATAEDKYTSPVEKLTALQLVTTPPAFYGTWKFGAAFKRA